MTTRFVPAADDCCVSGITLYHRMAILYLLQILEIFLVAFLICASSFDHWHDIHHFRDHVHVSCRPGLLQHGFTHSPGK